MNVWDGTYFHVIDLNGVTPETKITAPSSVKFLASSFDVTTGDLYILGQFGQMIAGPCRANDTGIGGCTPTQVLYVGDPTVYRLTEKSKSFDTILSYPKFSSAAYEQISSFAFDTTHQSVVGVDQAYSQPITQQSLQQVSNSSLCAQVVSTTFQRAIPRLFSIGVISKNLNAYNFYPETTPDPRNYTDLCGNNFNYLDYHVLVQTFNFFGTSSFAQ